MTQKLNVVYVSTEVSPYAKSGELADVACSLPKYLANAGIKVSIIMPMYRTPEIESLSKELDVPHLVVPIGERNVKARVFKSEHGKYDLYFIDNPQYFWRENIYGTGKGDYLDNDERFIFFSRAVLEFLLKKKMHADILHCNSWPTALVPVFLKTHYAQKSLFKETATVFTLHNIAYQGEFPPETLELAGLSWDYFSPKQLSLNGKFNFLKAGVLFSDVINTVSSSYRKDILTAELGLGLEDILKSREEDFFSVLNGVDYETWNPETDPFIVANYSSSKLTPKKRCKRDLIREFGLSLDTNIPIFGIISYLTYHKGFDILIEAMDKLMEWELGIVVLGSGDEFYEKRLVEFQRKHPKKIAFRVDMNPSLIHKIVAGADMILIPSLCEPCGLYQLYSFKYGTVPVVRATGGLEETVTPFEPKTVRGNGFVFKKYSSQALLDAVQEALFYYKKPRIWKKIVKEGLRQNFSWENAAKKYRELYQNALEKRKGGSFG